MWKTYYFNFWRKHKSLLVLIGTTALLSNLLTIALTLFIGRFFQLQFGYQTAKSNMLQFYPFSLATDLTSFYLLFACILALKLGFFYVARYKSEVAGLVMIKELKKEIFDWQLSIPLYHYKNKGAAKFMLRFSGDMNNVKRHFLQGMLLWSTDLVLIGVVILVLLYANLMLGITLVAVLITASLLLRILDNRLYLLSEMTGVKSSRLFSHISNTLHHIETIQVLNRSKVQIKTFQKHNESYAKAANRQYHTEALYRTSIPFITYFLILMALVISGYQRGAVASPDIVSTILLILYVTPIVKRVLAAGIIREKGALSWKNIEAVKALTVEDTGREIRTHQVELKIKSGKDWKELPPGIHHLAHAFPIHYMDNWLLLRPVGKDKIYFNRKPIARWKSDQWKKLVCPIDERYGLLGKTLHEQVCPHLRIFPEGILQKINAILPPGKQLSLEMNTGANGSLLSPMQKKMVMILRAVLSPGPIIIARNLMEHIPEKKQGLIMAFLRELEAERVILLLESPLKKPDQNPDDLDMQQPNNIVLLGK